MTLGAPAALLGLALLAPVIALYFLKLRRKKVRVPSTWLWIRSTNDLRVNAPFQRLRMNVLLILQVLLITLLTLALARPRGGAMRGEATPHILLIDRSASMAATDVEPSRLEEAKALARALVDRLPEDDPVMIVAFAATPQVVLPFTTDRTRIRSALETIQATDAPTHLAEALATAEATAMSRIEGALLAAETGGTAPASREARIVVFSDGAIAEPATTSGLPIEYVRIGSSAPANVAITAIEARPPARADGKWIAFAQVERFGGAEGEVRVELYVDGELRAARRVAVEPGGARPVLFEFSGPAPRAIEMRIEADGNQLAADDRAVYPVHLEPARVAIVTAGNFLLEQVVGTLPHMEVYRAAPEDWRAATAQADVVVLDAFVPEELPPGNYLIFGTVPRWEGITAGGESAREPAVVDWDRRHPVTRDLALRDLYVKEAPRVALPEHATVLVESRETPLVFAWERGRMRAIVVPFDILQSSWPLHVSFPLFVGSAIEWLRWDPAAAWNARAKPGDPLRVRMRRGAARATVHTPDRRAEVVEAPEPGGEAVLAGTDRAGLYRIVHEDGSEDLVARNLFDPLESSLVVRDALALKEGAVPAQPAQSAPQREWWPLVALAALVLLMAEWFVYHYRWGA